MLRGREAEQLLLMALLDEASSGHSCALVLQGPPGVGKSALLDDAADHAQGMQVLRTQGAEFESDLPFSALHQLLRPAMAAANALSPPQQEALSVAFGEKDAGHNDRFLVYAATLSLIAETAEAGPVLCVVDDAHWLDEGSAHALLFAARRFSTEPVAMLFATRLHDAGGFDARGLRNLSLSGLESEAAHALLEESAEGTVDSHVSDRLLTSTAGNPLALIELTAALTLEELSGQDPLPTSLPLTEGVERVFLDRVRRLPGNTQAVLLIAAAEGTGDLATIQAAAEAVGTEPAALESAERSGLVHVRRNRLEFQHPLVRSSVYGSATTAARQEAHRALAQALAGPSGLDRRVWHRAAATLGHDDKVASELDQVAGDAARRGAPAGACAAFERAATLSADPEARARRTWLAAEQARLAGQHRRAVSLLAAARAATSDPLLRADIDLSAGAVELVADSAESAERILSSAAGEMLTVDPKRARYLLVVAVQAAALTDSDAAVKIGRLAAELPKGTDEQERFFADFLLGCSSYLKGDFAAATEPLRRVIANAVDLDESTMLTWAAGAAFYVGDDEATYRFDKRAVMGARAVGAIGNVLPPLQRLALVEIFQGRWSTAAATAAEAMRLARETNQLNLASFLPCWLALLAAYRGDSASLAAHLAEADELLLEHPISLPHEALRWVRAIVELSERNSEAALEHLMSINSPSISLMASLDRIEAAVQARRTEQARGWLSQLEAFASATEAPWAQARVAHARALLNGPAKGQEYFEESLKRHQRARRPFERARVELSYGELLRRAGRRVDSRRHLRTALAVFDDLGARPWAERAGQELRASGESVRKRESTEHPRLTAQELQVANLVAQGMSNREVAAQLFVSPRTVDFHLRNVFTKLGLSSRSQLVHQDLDQHGPPTR